MSDSLTDILSNRNFAEPPEVKVIKDFVLAEVGVTPAVAVNKTAFIVSMPSASAAGTLRFKLFQLQRRLGNQRKIIIRIH